MPARPLARVQGFPTPRGPLGLRVRRGDVILLRGPNGCGKTSLLRQLAGLDAPVRAERVEVLGADPRREPARALKGALATQDPRDGLAGLTVAGEFRLRSVPLPPGLEPWAARPTASLSSGEARAVALGACEAAGRPLLLLDEPEEGLDAGAGEELRDMVRRHARHGAVVAAGHTEALRAVATRTVHLGRPHRGPPWRRLPRPRGPVRLACPPGRVDARGVLVPGVAWAPGLHAVTGRNGSGKSTSLARWAGLLGKGPLVDGEPALPGGNVRLLLPRAREHLFGHRVRDELAVAEPWARRLVPPALLDRHPLRVSGGQAQRIALAKCLGSPAPVYLLDEPEAHLDPAGRRLLAQAIARRVREGAVVAVATHDGALAAAAHSVTELA